MCVCEFILVCFLFSVFGLCFVSCVFFFPHYLDNNCSLKAFKGETIKAISYEY